MKHTHRSSNVLYAALFCIASACGLGEDRQKAEAAVETFHVQLNGSHFDQIYSSATPAFKSSGPETGFVEYVGAVRRKLGLFKNGRQTFWRVNTTTAGTLVDLNYESQFEQDTATEEFTFLMTGGRPVLHRYNINSRTLVTK